MFEHALDSAPFGEYGEWPHRPVAYAYYDLLLSAKLVIGFVFGYFLDLNM